MNKAIQAAPLKEIDSAVFDAIKAETNRQQTHIELIASENFVIPAVMEAMGSTLTNKYAEGYPGKRYYGGCEFVDIVEQLAIDRAKQLFGVKFANVQPHSGSQANTAVYTAVLKPGDKILTMSLEHGGHLSHGHPKNISGMLFHVVNYGVDVDTGYIDYDKLEEIALAEKPKLITVGASAYPRKIDFERMGKIAKKSGAYLMADIAHIAGLVATGQHPSPVPYCDFVTTTTHKTLRGPRGGLIMTNDEALAKAIDSAIFPGTQGGPLMHVIAGKAVCFGEALKPEFKDYQAQIIKNAKALEAAFRAEGIKMVSDGTDNHLLLLDFSDTEMTGKLLETLLEEANITVNKNTVPNETRSPFVTSGVRVGTPAVTSRGFKEADMAKVAKWIARVVREGENAVPSVKAEVEAFMKNFPLYE